MPAATGRSAWMQTCLRRLIVDYPGNIREMQNIIEHLAVMCEGVPGQGAPAASVLAATSQAIAAPTATSSMARRWHSPAYRSRCGAGCLGIPRPSLIPASFLHILKQHLPLPR